MKDFPENFDYDSTRKYYYVSGDAQEIYFDGSKKSIEFLRKNLALRPNLKKKIFLKLLPYWRFNPVKNMVELPFDTKEGFPGNLILSASRTVSFNFQKQKVVRTDIQNPRKEQQFRNQLIDIGINVPEITETGQSYVVEEYVDVERISSLKNNKDVLRNAYKDLLKFYDWKGIEKDRDGIYKTTVHGDFKIANLGKGSNTVCIFDWENIGHEPLFFDLLMALWMEYFFTSNFYPELLNNIMDLSVERLGIEGEAASKTVLFSLESLLGHKDTVKAREFKRKVRDIYGE